MGYQRLDYLKRCQILAFWKAGLSQTDIAKEVGVHKSTISREFHRNMTLLHTRNGCWTYKPDYAQCYAEERRTLKRNFYKFTPEVEEFVREKLLEEWSPEQIRGYAEENGLFSISHERIYQFVLQDKEAGSTLYKHLRHQNKRYRKRYGSPKRENAIKDRVMIDERPAVVGEKVRVGDWEIGTIIGKDRKQAVLSIVERVSKFTLLKKLQFKTADATKTALIQALSEHKEKVLTITADNGTEFARHKLVSHQLKHSDRLMPNTGGYGEEFGFENSASLYSCFYRYFFYLLCSCWIIWRKLFAGCFTKRAEIFRKLSSYRISSPAVL